MKTWLRSPIEQVCGRCCARIHRGDVVQILSSSQGYPWKKARCCACAEGTPPELPALETPQIAVSPTVKPTKHWTRIGAVDWKAKASA